MSYMMSDTSGNVPALFTPEQLLTLRTLRMRYGEDHDYFSERELAKLRFLRWLLESRHLQSESTGEDAGIEKDSDNAHNPSESEETTR